MCGATERRPILEMPDLMLGKPGQFGIVRCEACSLVYSSPRPTRESLGFFYEGAYSNGQGPGRRTRGAAEGSSPGQGKSEHGMRRAQTEGAAAWLQHARWGQLRLHVTLGPEQRLLDVGCGYGAFLRLIHEKTGCQVFGVDMDPGSIEHTVAPEAATLLRGELVDAAFPDDHFDAVTLFHSLEHTIDPVATLVEARRILKPGGTLMVEVPHFAGALRSVFGRYWFPLLMPQHLVHFEQPTLRAAFEAAGFEHLRLLRPCWAPGELVLSLGLWVKASRDAWRSPGEPRPTDGPLDFVLGALLVVLFFFVDLPLNALLTWTGYSGHQVAVARKEAAPGQAQRPGE